MKKFLFLFFIGFIPLLGVAQENSLQALTAEGNKAFVEIVDVKKNIPEAKKAIIDSLQGKEWNKWQLVDDVKNADFILKVLVEKKRKNYVSFTSDGARVRVIAEVHSLDHKLLWKSQCYQGNATLFTGFRALDDAMRKLVRRALGDELFGIKVGKQ